MRYAVFAFVGLLALPATGQSQSLAEAARRERERREQRQQDGSSDEVPSYGNEDLAAADGDETASDDDGRPDAGEEADEAPDEQAAADRESARRDRLREASDSRARQRRQAEAHWRRAAAQARARIDAAKRELAALDEMWLVEGERYVDAEGRTVIRDLDHLRQLKQRAEQELADAETAFDDLRARARREGVPPGWLR